MRIILHIICNLILCLSIGHAQDFNIIDYGAIGDGKTNNTLSIQSAIDAAHAKGQGKVIVPDGQFLTGSITLKSGVELHLNEGAVILGSTKHVDHKVVEKSYMRSIIMASYQENISITGKGTIDGQGREAALHVDSLFHMGALDSKRYNHVEGRPRFYMRSMLVVFVGCKNILISGVTLKDAASWVQHYDRCTNLIIENINVDSDAYWNNDGIDISDSKNVIVRNCNINSADDGICLKSHFEDHYIDNVLITDCTVRSSASAIKFGTKSLGGFKNVTIKNIKVYDTFRSAIAIESVDGGFLENVLVDNITAINTGNAIFIKLGNREPEKGNSTLKNVTLKNIKVEVAFERPDYAYDMRGPALPFFHNTFPSSITGMPGHNVENLILENIEIIYPGRGNRGLAYSPLYKLKDVPEAEDEYPEFSMYGELPAWGFYIRHVNGLKMNNITLSIDEKDYRSAIVLDDVKNLESTNLTIEGDKKSAKIILHNTENIKMDKTESVRKM